MFKRGDKVVHVDYGMGVIWKVNPNDIIRYKDNNHNQIPHKGIIYVAFDSEMGEDDSNGEQKTHIMLSDGREQPVGSGYFWNGVFNEFDNSIKLSKIN